MFHLSHPSISSVGFSAMGSVSSALSLKTLPQDLLDKEGLTIAFVNQSEYLNL